MQRDILQKTLDYIESNIKTQLTPDELALNASYSTYHFYRMFSSEMGMSVSTYILNRRLKNALYDIAQGYKAIDVVLEYGFDTYAGFYKAFVREYGCSPKKYIAIYGVPVRKPKQMEVMVMSITRNQIKEILSNWDIDQNLEIHDVEYMDGAKIADDVWRIGDDYFLRIRADRTRQLKNIALAKAINRQGLGSALPVLTKTGDEYINGETLLILTKRVKGIPYEFLAQIGEQSILYANECGRAIAKLHKALITVSTEISVDNADIFKTVCEWALPNVQKQNIQWSMGLPDSFFTDYIETFGKLQAKLPRQIIHRDPNPSNILFDGGMVSGFIDFDLSEHNVRLFDPCYYSTGVLCGAETDEQFEKWLSIAAQILKAYDAEISLSDEEKQSVFYVMCSIQLICIAYFDSIDDPDFKRLTQTNRKMLQFIVANKDKLEKIF